MANYALSVVNGRGYGDPTRTRGPTVEGRVAVNPMKELTIAVAGQAGTLGQNVVGTKTPRTATRFDAVVAWVGGPLRLGVTGMLAQNYDKAIVTSSTAKTDKSLGASAWASYNFDPVSVFGRVDYFQPKKDTAKDLKDLYFDVGVDYKAAKPVDIALVYKHEQVKSGDDCHLQRDHRLRGGGEGRHLPGGRSLGAVQLLTGARWSLVSPPRRPDARGGGVSRLRDLRGAQPHPEPAAAGIALHAHLAAHALDEVLHDGEAQPGAALVAGPARRRRGRSARRSGAGGGARCPGRCPARPRPSRPRPGRPPPSPVPRRCTSRRCPPG